MIKLTPATAAAKTSDGPGPRPQPPPGGGVPNEHPAPARARGCDPASDAAGTNATSALAAGAREAAAPSGIGIYVHFPWCVRKCPYCDFLSVPSAREDIPHAEYADAVLSELAARRAELAAAPLRSVFFGGGTPSLWKSRQLGRVLAGILEAFPAPAPPEVTVECNPGSLGDRTARALLDAGVNRLSIGVQGLDDERLRFLGRWHDARQALAAVSAALASGMPRVSADLIFGVSGQAPEQAAHEARTLAELGVGHLSAYALTIEPQTAFGARARKGRLPLATEQSVADSFLAVEGALGALGFEHYEISNYSRPGQRAQHNLGYWRGLDYVGLGCGAWGTVTRSGQRHRYRNRPQPSAYLSTALAARPGRPCRELESESEALPPEVQLSEMILLGLRLAEGVDVEEAAARSGARVWTAERERAATRLEARGLLRREGSRLVIPRSAWLLADGVIAELL